MRTIDQAWAEGQTAAETGAPRTCPYGYDVGEPIGWHVDTRRAWYRAYDNEMAGQRLDRSSRDEPLLDRG